MLECRRLTSDWASGLADFFHAVEHAGDSKHFHPHPLTREEAEARARYAGKDLYYVLVEGKRVLGYGMLRGWDEGYQVPSLGIVMHPSLQGAGLGKMFMHFLHAAARRRGVSQVRLKVYPHNVKALRLYEALGYCFTGEEAGQLIGFVDL